MIAEPVMGAGGVIVPPPGYYEAIQAVLDRHDILLIADEVICGFGRLGRWFGTEALNMKPDLITIAKGVTSAYVPLSGCLVSEKVWRTIVEGSARLGPFGHGFHLSMPQITRKTDKGLPRYDDANDSDVFILSGAEDLVSKRILNRTTFGKIRTRITAR